MSIDLVVKLRRTVALNELSAAISSAINDVLNVSHFPPISILEQISGVWTKAEANMLERDGQYFVIKLLGYDEAIGISVIEVAHSKILDYSDIGIWVHVSVAAMRSPLEFALAGCVALSLARLNDVEVIDERQRWTNQYRQSAIEFADAIKVHGHFEDINEAAITFSSQMNSKLKRLK